MKIKLSLLVLLIAFSAGAQQYVILLHGGAGNGISPENFDEARQTQYSEKMLEALDSGKAVLDTGGQALDAVTAVIKVLENSPLFNCLYLSSRNIHSPNVERPKIFGSLKEKKFKNMNIG